MQRAPQVPSNDRNQAPQFAEVPVFSARCACKGGSAVHVGFANRGRSTAAALAARGAEALVAQRATAGSVAPPPGGASGCSRHGLNLNWSVEVPVEALRRSTELPNDASFHSRSVSGGALVSPDASGKSSGKHTHTGSAFRVPVDVVGGGACHRSLPPCATSPAQRSMGYAPVSIPVDVVGTPSACTAAAATAGRRTAVPVDVVGGRQPALQGVSQSRQGGGPGPLVSSGGVPRPVPVEVDVSRLGSAPRTPGNSTISAAHNQSGLSNYGEASAAIMGPIPVQVDTAAPKADTVPMVLPTAFGMRDPPIPVQLISRPGGSWHEAGGGSVPSPKFGMPEPVDRPVGNMPCSGGSPRRFSSCGGPQRGDPEIGLRLDLSGLDMPELAPQFSPQRSVLQDHGSVATYVKKLENSCQSQPSFHGASLSPSRDGPGVGAAAAGAARQGVLAAVSSSAYSPRGKKWPTSPPVEPQQCAAPADAGQSNPEDFERTPSRPPDVSNEVPSEFAFEVPQCSPGAVLTVTAPDGVCLQIPLPDDVLPGDQLHLSKDAGATWSISKAVRGVLVPQDGPSISGPSIESRPDF